MVDVGRRREEHFDWICFEDFVKDKFRAWRMDTEPSN